MGDLDGQCRQQAAQLLRLSWEMRHNNQELLKHQLLII